MTTPRGTADLVEPRPTAGAADAVEAVVRAMVGRPLPVGLRCWDGSVRPGPDGAPVLVVRSPRALRYVLWAPTELGLARAYVSGEVDVEGDLYAALASPGLLPGRPDLRADRRELARLLPALARHGVVGPPPSPPAEEARLRGARHSLRRDRQAISHHYDVGNDFYALLLGPSMVYSCAVFPDAGATLEQAQEVKLEMVCRKLGLVAGQRLLDVGCGWGSLALHAAERHGARVVGVTLSQAQADLARRRVDAAVRAGRVRPAQVQVRVQDYREVDDGPYDAVASVGMAEHVGRDELPRYAATLHGLLVDGGRLLNHAIARGPLAEPPQRDRDSFLSRYVFPDGELQPLATHVEVLEAARFEVRHVEALREHYARTCRTWVSRLEARWDDAVRLAGPGRARVWQLYLAGAALAFEARRTGVNQVLAVRA